MSNVIPMQNDQDRRQQAAEWIAKMDRDLSSSELEQLRAWIRADQRNERELEECARLWDMLGALHSLADLMPQEKKPSILASCGVGGLPCPGVGGWLGSPGERCFSAAGP